MRRKTWTLSLVHPELVAASRRGGCAVAVKWTLYAHLVKWKTSTRRKPLLLRGAPQTGKTWLLREFGESEYERVAHFDFERDPALDGFFRRNLDPHRIVADLSLYARTDIHPGRDLIVFDMAGPGSFPVGRVNFLDLHPMCFGEFLTAMGRSRYAAMPEGLEEFHPLPDAIHGDLVDLLRQYCFVGGMPEAVRTFAESGSPDAAREIHREILDSFLLDFAKHAPASDIPKLGLVWDSIPRHLAKENRKFMFSIVKKGARAREYENALRWLGDAGLVHFCHAVSTGRPPLRQYADRSCFKVFPLDVGLLGALARTPATLLVRGDALFTELRGALAGSHVAQQLVAARVRDLHYRRSAGGKAQIDFLCESGGAVVPVEVKAGLSRKSKSLRSYDQQFSPEMLVRTNLLNLKKDGQIANIPLYAAAEIPRLALGAHGGTG